ncbi:MAG: type IV pilus twitching motility protein PilT [Armatimonadetes bacterium]|nr:type IV pilus twitching motility protein PilT [Armatimonadota bacterium]
MQNLLLHMMDVAASDLHLCVGMPPIVRIDGELFPVEGVTALSAEDLKSMVYSMINDYQRRLFDERWELDFSYSLPGVSRFRGNILMQRGTVGCVLRAVPPRPFTMEELGLPAIIPEMCRKPRGLILICGPTGSGKSTTLAAMIDHINESRKCHIVTIEDPIEFVHRNKKAIVRQRELGMDTKGFAEALKHVLRQDPDVIMVGEMRDLESISLTITAAETGHLVLATLHTIGAATAVDRMIDVFPPHKQNQVRLQLSMTLEGVISQSLVPRADGMGRVLAAEVLLGTPAIRNLIREAKTHQIVSMMHSSGAIGMQTLDYALKRLVEQRVVTLDDALAESSDPSELLRLLGHGHARSV